MVSVGGLKHKSDKILEEFEHLQNNDKIVIGSLDSEIKDFIRDSVYSMIENYSDDDFYYGVVEVLSDFVYELSDEGTGYQVWSEVDFSKVNEIGFGLKEDLDFLKEVLIFYS